MKKSAFAGFFIKQSIRTIEQWNSSVLLVTGK